MLRFVRLRLTWGTADQYRR